MSGRKLLHPTTYVLDTGGSVSGVKRPGTEDAYVSLFRAVFKKEWLHTSTPTYAFIVCTGTILPSVLLISGVN